MAITAAEARRNLERLIEQINLDQKAIEIVSGRGSAVLIPKDQYDSLMETGHLLRSPANARRLLAALGSTAASDVRVGGSRPHMNWNDPRMEDIMAQPKIKKSLPANTSLTDLAGVVFSAGRVFEGLTAGRLDTEKFLRFGSFDGVTSRSDLALLKDLRDVSRFIIDQSRLHPPKPITVDFVCAVNAKITRSGAIHPGQLRTADQQIGVNTRHGRHTPVAMTDTSLRRLLQTSLSNPDTREAALDLFVNLAKAQPFEDGNKRTALFVANSLLLSSGTGELLTIPVDENDPSLADAFNDLLARTYVLDEHTGVKNLLREHGLTPLRGHARRDSRAETGDIRDAIDGTAFVAGSSEHLKE